MAIKVTIDDNFNNPKVKVLMLKGEKGDTGDVNTEQLNAEISARTLADANLQSQITGLASGSPLVASSTSGVVRALKREVNHNSRAKEQAALSHSVSGNLKHCPANTVRSEEHHRKHNV